MDQGFLSPPHPKRLPMRCEARTQNAELRLGELFCKNKLDLKRRKMTQSVHRNTETPCHRVREDLATRCDRRQERDCKIEEPGTVKTQAKGHCCLVHVENGTKQNNIFVCTRKSSDFDTHKIIRIKCSKVFKTGLYHLLCQTCTCPLSLSPSGLG